MKQKLTALLLALTLVLSLCAVSAVAGEESAAAEEEAASAETANGEAAAEQETEIEEVPSLAGPDAGPEVDPETGKPLESAEIVPDEVGTVSFANIERRMRGNNLSILMMQESVDLLESIDYEDLKEELRKQLNDVAKGQWFMVEMGMTDTLSYQQMDQAYDAIREQFDAIKDGDLQEDNEGVMRQLRNLQDQIVMGGEATYIALVSLSAQEAALQRQLAALNRTVEEMELRYQMGQISALQLSEVKAGRTALASGLETLRMNLKNTKLQLEKLLGAELTGEIRLGTVPEVTEEQLSAMDMEQDLLAAKAKSYELFDATRTYEDAQEVYKDKRIWVGNNENLLEVRQYKHTWQAAQYTYANAIQDYELRFRVLYAQVKDYQQALAASKVSLESEKSSFAASELKYQQGTISQNAYLTAQDDLRAAEDAVQTAANDLFSSYNTYCWAVQHGILN